MNKRNYVFATVFILLAVFIVGCKPAEPAPAPAETPAAPAAPDMAKVKAEIQTLESAWAAADNARDAKTLSEFYAEDAVSLSNNQPLVSGKAAILKDIEASLAKKEKGRTVAFDVTEVFGDDNTVTEIGVTTAKDASGKVVYTGKYMAIWTKRDGKYVCIRDISNDDAKAK